MTERKKKEEMHHKQEKDDQIDNRYFNGAITINISNIEDRLFEELQGLIDESILIVTESDQLNLFGQTFRPIFCGTIINVTQGDVTLFPVNIKMINAPFFQFPTPLNIPLEKIAHFTPNFDCNQRIPLT
ncbi:hypothetical protein CJ195_08635 [Bacillus sp. UMB0899]|nr:hypothetical protein CJ195_08635 [Bacillus sp. UMB0899]